MPRAKRKPVITLPESPAQQVAEALDLPTAAMIPDPTLPDIDGKLFEVAPRADEPLLPLHRAEHKTLRPFTGRVASGRGVTVTADDTSFAIKSDHPLAAGQIALAQRNGFDDYSEGQDGRIMVADKAEMRRVGGDVNWVARSVTGPESGRSR